MACSPAWIDEFPFAVVDSDSVPGVAGAEGRTFFSGLEGVIAETFSVARDDYAL